MRTRTTSILLAAAAACSLAVPAAAQAGDISYDGDDLVYTAAPGETNSFWVYESPVYGRGYVTISDNAPVNFPSEQCAADGDRVHCVAPGAVYALLGDGNDKGGFGISQKLANPAVISGGPGDDKLTGNEYGPTVAALIGDEGKDVLKGGPGDEELQGGAGNDDVNGGGGRDGVSGGEGDDKVNGDGYADPAADGIDGGPGYDYVEGWTQPANDTHPPADVILDGQANDGRAGEGDDVRDVEKVQAHVAGTFVMTDAADDVDIWSNLSGGASRVETRGGNDRLRGGNNEETLDGGAGDDRVEGGFGNDTLTGGPGRDQIYGDRTDAQCGLFETCTVPFGNDIIDARDGEADVVDCGVGTDSVKADAIDTLSGCESVEGAAPGPPAPPSPPVKPTGDDEVPAAAGTTLSGTARRRGGRILVSGRLTAPAGSCSGARVTLTVKARGGKVVARGRAKLSRTCRYSAGLRPRGARGKLTVTVRFTGTGRLAAAPARTLRVR